MNIKKVAPFFKEKLSTVDWTLLTFLLLFLNVKLAVKVGAIILMYIMRPYFKFGFSIKNTRLPIFFLSVICIALINWFASGLLTNINYSIAVITGILFWVLCILAIHQTKLSVEKNSVAIIHQTLLVFFAINIIASLLVYGSIIWETGAINPYRYQGHFQKYFISTGDYIKGITIDTSTTNAVINAFGVIYFLMRSKFAWAIFCMISLILTGSNITNLLLCCTLLYIFIFQSRKEQKSIIIVCLLMIVVFLVKVSPQNNTYITTAYEKLFNTYKPSKPATTQIPITQKPDSLLNNEEKKQKLATLYLDSLYKKVSLNNEPEVQGATTTVINLKQKPIIPQPNIHSASFQHKNDTTIFQIKLIEFIKEDSLQQPVSVAKQYNLPGKLIALIQTAAYFKLHPLKLITGAGIGMFSSKLAFRISALKIAGGYPEKLAFISDDFKNNNLSLYLNYFTKPAAVHSLINTPNSTYNQLLSEYGLVGLAAFAIFYLWYFLKHASKLTYGIPLLLLMAGLFFMEYWFEQLSVTVLFELLLFINLKENNEAAS